MSAGPRLLIVLVVLPLAAAVAWITARASAPTGDANYAALAARLDQLERARGELQAARGTDDLRGILRRIEALEQRAGTPPAAAQPPADAPTAPPSEAAKAESARNDELRATRDELRRALQAERGTPERRAAIRKLGDFFVKGAASPQASGEAQWAGMQLQHLAEHMSPDEAADLAATMQTLEPGHAARPALAVAVAGGWLEDERLKGFLAQMGPNREPGVTARVVEFLEDHPSADFTDLWLRLVREEKDARVLGRLFDDTPVESAASTVDNATRVVQAVEVRVTDGGWDAATRGRGSYAIAVAGLRVPELGAETLRRLADREQDTKLAKAQRQAATDLLDRTATIKGLEKWFR